MKLFRILQPALPCYCTPIVVTRLKYHKTPCNPHLFRYIIYKLDKIKRYVSKILYRIQ